MAFWHFKISPTEDDSDDQEEAEETVEEQAEEATRKMAKTTVELNMSILRLQEIAE